MQIRANVAARKLRAESANSVCLHEHIPNLPNLTHDHIRRGQGQPRQQQSGGSAGVSVTAVTVAVSTEATLSGITGQSPASTTTDDKPGGKNVPVAQGVVLL